MRAPARAPAQEWRYIVALGSNQRHHRHGPPEGVLRAALAALAAAGVAVERVSPLIRSAPMGPSWRRYANGAVLLRCPLMPDALLAVLKGLEAGFGRRRGRRWGARVLDLDIVLWSGGRWRSGRRAEQAGWLSVPHAAFRQRDFVLGPASAVAPRWRDPCTALRLFHLQARLTRARFTPR